MERRKIPDRRKVHVFVSQDRRTGPFDRRGASARLRERTDEIEKIKKIQSFKEKDKMAAPAAFGLDKKRIIFLALALLILLVALFSLK